MFLYSDIITVSWTKVLISGPPGSGKSSSLKLLLNEESGDNKHRSTPVLQPVLAKQCTENKWKRIDGSIIDEIELNPHFIHIVDTGGQAAFLDIAPVFLHGNSAVVNIFTVKLDKDLEDEVDICYYIEGKPIGAGTVKRKITYEHLLEWLIRSLVRKPSENNSASSAHDNNTSFHIEKFFDSGNPSIIVLGTFYDKIGDDKLKHKNEFLSEFLKRNFAKNASIQNYRMNKPIFPLNAIQREDKQNSVADRVRRKTCLSYNKVKIPCNWLQFFKKLQNYQEDKGILKFEKCCEMGKKHGMNDKNIRDALLLYHDLSGVLYFEELPNIVFLKPQMLFDEITKLVSISFEDGVNFLDIEKDIDIPSNAHDNMQYGIFQVDVLEKIVNRGLCKPEEFLNLLIELHITAEFKASKLTGYFLPCVLKAAEKSTVLQLKKNYEVKVDPLILYWDGKMIPQGLFCALIVCLLKNKNIRAEDIGKQQDYYRNAIQLSCQFAGGILLIDSVTYLEVYYNGKPSNCCKVKEMILQSLLMAVKTLKCHSNYANPELCFLHDCCQCQPKCTNSTCTNQRSHPCYLDKDFEYTTCTFNQNKVIEVKPVRQKLWLGMSHVYYTLNVLYRC